jgi:hypothetical protein
LAEFFKTSRVWVVDFLHDGRPRRWFKALAAPADVSSLMADTLRDLYGEHARLVAVRPASEEEELQYLRGEEPVNVYCPTGRPDPSTDPR